MAAEARVNPALPATAVVEFMTKRSNLCSRTVLLFFYKTRALITTITASHTPEARKLRHKNNRVEDVVRLVARHEKEEEDALGEEAGD